MLILYCLASMLLVHIPRVVMQPLTEVRWFELGEIATMLAGAWILFACSAPPSWLPVHFGWAYLTGAGHMAAGLAILLGVLPRLGATLEALMVSTFVLTVHVPGLLGAPGDRDQWTELFVACAIAGAAFLVADSYRRSLARSSL